MGIAHPLPKLEPEGVWPLVLAKTEDKMGGSRQDSFDQMASSGRRLRQDLIACRNKSVRSPLLGPLLTNSHNPMRQKGDDPLLTAGFSKALAAARLHLPYSLSPDRMEPIQGKWSQTNREWRRKTKDQSAWESAEQAILTTRNS